MRDYDEFSSDPDGQYDKMYPEKRALYQDFIDNINQYNITYISTDMMLHRTYAAFLHAQKEISGYLQ